MLSQSTNAGDIIPKRKRPAPLPTLQNAAIKKRTGIAQWQKPLVQNSCNTKKKTASQDLSHG
jgi:hypothetical protein